jgi:para-aminobenzoate synthetase
MQDFSRYSIMAGMTGPLSKRVDYYGMEHYDDHHRGVFVTARDGKRQKDDTVKNILEYLEHHQTAALIYESDDAANLPFVGGHLGYLGYEVRHDTQRKLDNILEPVTTQNGISNPNIPTAALLFCDQFLIMDHWNDKWYLVELTTSPEAITSSDWMSTTANVLRSLVPEPTPNGCTRSPPPRESKLQFTPNRSRPAYQTDIADCHEQIRLGESYELCLTNQLETTVPSSQDPFQLYKILRQHNPSPFAAYFNFQGNHEDETAKVTICCSSPERFISVQPHDGKLVVEAKPIKGTAARPPNPADDETVARELQESIKNRAENLMIVDLLRNDLNRVCKTGSVHVPKLMAIESYATVHQMVSTIRGILAPGKTNIDVLTSCFPGGSMTGAPKRRTMEILHEMEEGVSRGPYSGSLGYLSLNGRMDMNIVIRSIVLTPSGNNWKVSIGAGGAITALSESDDEYEEMLLKAQAVKESVEVWAATAGDVKHRNGKQANLCEVPVTDPIELQI